MSDATNMRKAGTGKSAIGLVVIAVVIIAAIAVAAWLLMQPGVMEEVLNVVLIIAGVIVVAVIVIYAVMALSAIPLYAMKGEQYQENVDYNIEDVKPVEGKTLEEEGPKYRS